MVNNIQKALEFYEKGAKLEHIPSIYNLAATYNDEECDYYNKALADEYYIKAANTEFDGIGNRITALMMKSIACSNAGRIYFEEKEYKKAEVIYNSALKIYSDLHLNVSEDDSIINYLQSRINAINRIISGSVKFTSKHEDVLKLFTDKAKKNLSDEHYIYIETSLLVWDFLTSNNYLHLDYSSVIMPILKCLESLLFNLFGTNYLVYLKTLKKVDYQLIPNNFINKNTKILVDKITTMELGKFVYVISSKPYSQDIIINQTFKDYMIQRGVNNDDKIYKDFLKRLIEIKERYRNIAAHKDIVDKELAENCLEYLLYETIRFINKFLETFY